MSLDLIKSAIAKRAPITFEYNKQGKTPGVRKGNPHAVFIMRRKDNTESTKVHIVQTAGVTDSGKELPSFRMFDILEISNVTVLETKSPFPIDDQYNPLWDGYKYVIAKV